LSEDERKVSVAWSELLYFNKRALVPTERTIGTSSSDGNRSVFMHRFGPATGLFGFTCPDRTAATPFYYWQLRVPFLHRRWVFVCWFIIIMFMKFHRKYSVLNARLATSTQNGLWNTWKVLLGSCLEWRWLATLGESLKCRILRTAKAEALMLGHGRTDGRTDVICT
jgi:hypothetical protein